MAKTRIKTTPTRMQKEALMASAAVTTTSNIVTQHAYKKRISVLKNAPSTPAKDVMPPVQSSIIVQPPKRTNSISSATSTISYTSDIGGSSHSCNETSPITNLNTATDNNGPTMAELTESAIKTLNAGLLAKSNALALKNRKVYMITEKRYDSSYAGNGNSSGFSGPNGLATGQKRKMYLIMEEKESEKAAGNHNEKIIKTENTNASKKLTLFTDTSNGQLPQTFEKILPEILNCIQAKKGASAVVTPLSGVLNNKTDLETNDLNEKTIVTEANTKIELKTETTERLPLTLPPKKNRTKIITTQIIPVNATQAICQNHQHSQNNGVDNCFSTSSAIAPEYVATNNNNGYSKPQKSSATTVIVNANSLMTSSSNGSINGNGLKSNENNNTNANQLHKNINLSTDFLFLMKMLPKLESIEEPQKTYVKNCIEDIIDQYAVDSNQMVDQ